MSSEKVSRAGNVSAHNNLTGRERSGGKDISEAEPAVQPQPSGGQGQSAASYSPTFSRNAATALELQSLMNMLAESNRQIGDAAGGLRPGQAEERTVPSVMGMPVGAALARMKALGFRVTKLSHQSRPGIPPGHIVGQIPAPGADAGPTKSVHLIVSRDSAKQSAGSDNIALA